MLVGWLLRWIQTNTLNAARGVIGGVVIAHAMGGLLAYAAFLNRLWLVPLCLQQVYADLCVLYWSWYCCSAISHMQPVLALQHIRQLKAALELAGCRSVSLQIWSALSQWPKPHFSTGLHCGA